MPLPSSSIHVPAGTERQNAATSSGDFILSVGHDDQLLSTRAQVLALTGRRVISAKPEQAAHLLESRQFCLVVLGHSLADKELAALAILARSRYPQTRLLATCFHARAAYVCDLVDEALDSGAGPARLVKVVRHLLEKP